MRFRCRSDGQLLVCEAATKIGSGGEADIYSVPGQTGLAAKIYHKPTEDHARKLKAMLANPPADPMQDEGHCSIAWPCDLVSTTDDLKKTAGFLMPRVRRQRPIIDFYHPATRRKQCPLFNYYYLLHTARNLAAAVRAIHADGYVIGDVNESNILVSDTALVTLVDTDSFQVRDSSSGQVYRCPVGKPEFTPPELQGQPFRDVDRTKEHDLFGLGVLIFQLLMEGSHPFAGKFAGQGDAPPLEKRIKAGHFPYGTGRVPYQPMPAAPPFDTMPTALRLMFLRCFEMGHTDPPARPTADEWRKALDTAIASLCICAANSQHQYGNHLSACPWCERTVQLHGLDPFPSEQAVKRGTHMRSVPPQVALAPARRVSQSPVAVPPAASPTPTVPPPPIPKAPFIGPILSRQRLVLGTLLVGLIAALALLGWEGVTVYKFFQPSPSVSSDPSQKAQTKINPKDGAEMIYIPPGAFWMGDNDDDFIKQDNPRHEVSLSGYYIYKNVVTVAQYEQFCKDTNHQMSDAPAFNPNWSKKDHPIVNVSWDDAKAYCDWAGVRLPTEAEWEKAARGIEGRLYPWSNTFDSSKVWCSKKQQGDAVGTTAVGQYGISPYGCTDMAGNVWQLCEDWYDANFLGSRVAELKDPVNESFGEKKHRVLRGASWYNNSPNAFRAANRTNDTSPSGSDLIGFRCATPGQ